MSNFTYIDPMVEQKKRQENWNNPQYWLTDSEIAYKQTLTLMNVAKEALPKGTSVKKLSSWGKLNKYWNSSLGDVKLSDNQLLEISKSLEDHASKEEFSLYMDKTMAYLLAKREFTLRHASYIACLNGSPYRCS